MTAELRYADSDDLLHQVTTEIDGTEANGVATVRNNDRLEGAGEAYDVTLVVTDTDGEVTEETEEITLDERSPPPSVDQFDLTASDFLGSPEVVVAWAVSDTGEELAGVDLELRAVGRDEPIDDASSMARDGTATGEDSLRDRGSEDGGEYEVTIRVTDYFEQTTEERAQITL